jgi:arylformamidase
MITSQLDFVDHEINRTEVRYKMMDQVEENLHRLDIYFASHLKRVPVIFYVHGGGLRKEDKRDLSSYLDKARFFVGKGYVFVSINYRLAPNAKVPSQIIDTADAFMYIYHHIVQFGGDPECIFVMGHSSGAYLVDLLATNESYLAQRNGKLSMIRGVISLDTEALFKATPFLTQAMDSSIQNVTEFLPGDHIQANKGIPPFFIFFNKSRYETGDQIAFAETLKLNGIPAEAIWCQQEGHHELNQSIGSKGDRKTQMILEFLKHPHRVEEIARNNNYIA